MHKIVDADDRAALVQCGDDTTRFDYSNKDWFYFEHERACGMCGKLVRVRVEMWVEEDGDGQAAPRIVEHLLGD